ncbi:hypothetical protein PVAP13_1NG242476 [Panicum virgatum]|uniref:Uncharacterized protein n=1 Tax=Panicum virgatum TaxID=38727 RepID=A0A8T0WMJ5_PANVG|nr:hypothetical protein PVAP13_1NG242476 [Panicum virgatum]
MVAASAVVADGTGCVDTPTHHRQDAAAPSVNPGPHPSPSTPAAAASSNTSNSSERPRAATPSYTASNASYGPQAGPSNIDADDGAINSFMAAHTASGLAGATTAIHPSFILKTRVARRGAPPFFNSDGFPMVTPPAASASASPAPMTTIPETTASATLVVSATASPAPSSSTAPTPACLLG